MDTTGGSNTVLVSNSQNDTRYVFNNVDGQTTASAVNNVASSGSGTVGYATAGGLASGGVSGNGGQLVQFKKDGTVDHVLSGVNESAYLGMWGAPNGHIIASAGGGRLVDIDPLANGGLGSSRLIATPGSTDGVSVSPDGTRAIVEISGLIQIYNIASGALLNIYSDSSLNSVDGTGVITSTNPSTATSSPLPIRVSLS
ncbi:MAG: hypothetical protein M3Y32_00670 [Pseudomonadota bacterium]|nr:hypothetical protein [Pseudomonadota bacterium]